MHLNICGLIFSSNILTALITLYSFFYKFHLESFNYSWKICCLFDLLFEADEVPHELDRGPDEGRFSEVGGDQDVVDLVVGVHEELADDLVMEHKYLDQIHLLEG